MKLLVRIFAAPLILLVLGLGAVDRLLGGSHWRRVDTAAGWARAISNGMTLGTMTGAIGSLTLILVGERLELSAGLVVGLCTFLPLLGGYLGAAVGWHWGGQRPMSPTDGGADGFKGPLH